MTDEEAKTAIRELLANGKIHELMGPQQGLRHRDRHAFLRVVMACPDELAPGGLIQWKDLSLDPSALDAPVTEDELTAWITPERPIPLLQRMAYVLHPDIAEPITSIQYMTRVSERAPARFSYVLETLGHDGSERTRQLQARFAAPFVDSIIAGERAIDNVSSKPIELGDLADMARLLEWLAGTDQELSPHTLEHFVPAAPLAPAAFAELATRVVKKVNKRDVDHFWIELGGLDADGVASVLAAVKGKDAQFERLAFLAAKTRTAAAADALARFLGDKKRGRAVARWLAVMGPEGRRAAREAAESATKKNQTDARTREMAEAVAKLPEAPTFLIDLDNRASSAWDLDLRDFAIDPGAPAEGAPPNEPVALADLERVLKDEKHQRDDLTPSAWADLLQIVTTPGWRDDLAWARERALSENLLGWGADPARLVAAIERFDFDAQIRIGWGDKGAVGLFHMLLGCDAPREVLFHALAVFARRHGSIVIGCAPRNFEKPIQDFKPEKHESLSLLVRHLELVRFNRMRVDEMERFPTLERAESCGPRWQSAAPHGDFRLALAVTGANLITVRFRDGAAFVVDVAARRWSQQGLGDKEGGWTSLLGGEPEITIGVEAVGPLARVGVNGTLVDNMMKGYVLDPPLGAGPIEIETDGVIERVRVTGAGSQRAAGDHASLLFGEAKLVKDVAEAHTATAALVLATMATLADDETLAESAKHALAEMPDVAGPWRQALGLESVESIEQPFPIRSFDECVKTWSELRGKEPKRAESVDGYDAAVAYRDPTSPDWSTTGVSEDTLYLAREGSYYGGVLTTRSR